MAESAVETCDDLRGWACDDHAAAPSGVQTCMCLVLALGAVARGCCAGRPRPAVRAGGGCPVEGAGPSRRRSRPPPLRMREVSASEPAARKNISRLRGPWETTGTGSAASRSGLFREPSPPRAAAAKADRLTSGIAVAPSSRGELSTLLSREAKCLAPGCPTTARRPKEPDRA